MKALSYLLLFALAGCGAESQGSHTGQAIVSGVAASARAVTENEVSLLDVDSIAPAFDLPGSDGRTHKLSDYAGQHVVLAFFPKAFTGG